MVYLSLVASHADLDLERIGLLSAAAPRVASASALSELFDGMLVLSTCNRFEVYTSLSSSENLEAARFELISMIAEETELPERVVASSLNTLIGDEVPRHLFAVASGLDSAVVGEREIAGQVRRSLLDAQERSSASGPLTRLFQSATRTAKEVGTQTALGSQGKSIVSVGLDLVENLMGSPEQLTQSKVVLFGTGAYAGATMSLLQAKGVSDIRVYSQTGRAEEFVASRSGIALDAADLPAAISAADVLIGCSGNGQRVSAEEIASLHSARPEHAGDLYMMDLALTHDFDPRSCEIPGVELLTLESIRLAAPAEAASALESARKIVDSSAGQFIAEYQSRHIDAAIVALRSHTFSVLEEELEKVRSQHGCTAAASEVEFALRRMVRQMLHVPTVRARQLAALGKAEDYVSALDALYDIQVPLPANPELEGKLTEKGSGEEGQDQACPVAHSA